MTGDFFGSNPYAGRFNVAVGKMGDFAGKLEAALHKLVLVDVYENFLEYLGKDIPRLMGECGSHGWTASAARRKPEAPERKFDRGWQNSGYLAIDGDLLETFTYLRLRRHHYAHAAEVISERFTGHTASAGARLNVYWAGKLPGAKLDFTSHDIFSPANDEIIALIRVAQSWIRALDAAVAAPLVPDKVVAFVARERLLAAGGRAFARNSMTVAQLARGVRADCEDKWGLRVKMAAAEAAVSAVDLTRL